MVRVKPIHYKIHLEPDLRAFKSAGWVEIIIEAEKPVKNISMNILELAIWGCGVRMKEDFLDCHFKVNPQKEQLTVILPEHMSGEIVLRIDYEGRINDRMAGFYRSGYKTGGADKYIAVTQFEESDARRAFPCFDRPVDKAVFEIEMLIDDDLTAISNEAVKEENPAGNGKKLVKFKQTPKMSTYLLFFGVGEFEFIDDKGRVLVRLGTVPEMTKYGNFGLDFGRKALDFCEGIFATDYPLPKLDLIAIPDFAFGAMENWGAITFRENLLLHYPGITSKAGEERICEIIAHEIVHQWFGNLVTPSDWKYLWLNESFATFYGYAVVDHYYPEWGVWDQFLNGETGIALNRDSLQETTPIEIPGGEHVVINPSTAPIIYNKGASVMRQIKDYIGDDSFIKGLRRYLSTYKYECSSSKDLWKSFDDITEKPVSRIMKSWIEQKGFPLITVERQGTQITLTQKRFTFLPNESSQKWIVPITARIFYRDGKSTAVRTLLKDRHASLDIGSDAAAYKINDGQTGFYRVKYCDRDVLPELGELVLTKKLSTEDRWGLQNDLYALVKSCGVSIDDYLEFLSYYNNEDAFLPITSISNNLFHAYSVMGGEKRAQIASTGKSLFDGVLSKIGYDPVKQESHTTSILRDQILLHTALYGSKDAGAYAADKFRLLLSGQAIHPDIMKSVLQIGAFNCGQDAFTFFIERLISSDSEHERMNILTAFGWFSEIHLIEKAGEYILGKVPARNKFVSIVSMATNPNATAYLWNWFVQHTGELEKLHPLHYERVIEGIVPLCGLEKEEEVKKFFENYGKAGEVVKLSLEKLEINSRMRRYNS